MKQYLTGITFRPRCGHVVLWAIVPACTVQAVAQLLTPLGGVIRPWGARLGSNGRPWAVITRGTLVGLIVQRGGRAIGTITTIVTWKKNI